MQCEELFEVKQRKEKDLGVTMKVSEQCIMLASKGNQVLGMICIKITHRENSLIVPLYNAILRKYIDMLEQIQRRAIKFIPGLRGLRYEERLWTDDTRNAGVK